jgi:hypothetical protein
MCSSGDIQLSRWMGCPIRNLRDQGLYAAPPERFVGLHVLHRLSAPRHPPRTLCSLFFLVHDACQREPSTGLGLVVIDALSSTHAWLTLNERPSRAEDPGLLSPLLACCWLPLPGPTPLKTSRSIIRATSLRLLPALHVSSIYQVFFLGSSSHCCDGKTHLGSGFALRCFQRFSLLDVAIQLWGRPPNWLTSGLAISVLSY